MNGPAVWKDAGELVVRHARPVAHAADVEMDERRAGTRIVADAAALHPQAGLALRLERHAGNEKVHRLAEHVLAELGDPAAAPAQRRVGRGRAIAAHDMDRALRVDVAIDLPHDVEQARIHTDLLVAPPVAQQMVDLLERLFVVAPVALVGDGEVFAGMDVVQRYGPRVALGDGVLQTLAAQQQSHRGDAEPRRTWLTDSYDWDRLTRDERPVPLPHPN